jgi:diguanylate cyclase (GGDEF)-like protein/PAS domain S-box-containing protein
VAEKKKKSNIPSKLRTSAEKQLKKQKKKPVQEMTDIEVQGLVHELQVHQIELEMQNEELRNAQIEIENLILEVNLAGGGLLQMERSSLIKKPFSQFVHKKYRDTFYVHSRKVFETKTRQTCEIMLLLKPREHTYIQKYVHLVSIAFQDSDGNFSLLRTTVSDITERKLAEEIVVRARDEWEQTFDTIPDPIGVIDKQHRILRANRAMAEKFGVKREEMIGKLCYKVVHRTDKPPHYCPHAKTITEGKENISEIYEERLNAHFISSANSIFDAEGRTVGIVQVFRDITARKKMEEKLHAAVITDELTGLLNRRGFFTLADQQCKLADRAMRRMYLLYLDLNNLKPINDEFGHKTGDQALKDTANVLRKTFRESDIIARIGGDEFAVLITEPSKTDIKDIIIGHIQDNLRIHNEKSGHGYDLSLSMGFARYNPEYPCSIGGLLTRADALMYKDKEHHKAEQQTLRSFTGEKRKKRVYRRFRTNTTCVAELDNVNQAKIENISIGGLCLKTSHKLPVKSICSISLSTRRNEKKIANGLVVWSDSRDKNQMAGGLPYKAGLTFINLNDSLRNYLERFIENISV